MARFVLMVLLATAFLLTIAGGFLSTLLGDDGHRKATKDLLTVLLPAETALLGAGVAFYYTGGT